MNFGEASAAACAFGAFMRSAVHVSAMLRTCNAYARQRDVAHLH